MKKRLIAGITALIVTPIIIFSLWLIKQKAEDKPNDLASPIVPQSVSDVTNQTAEIVNETVNKIIPKKQAEYGLNSEQKRRADELISLFENGTTTIAYDYIEDIDDGRGYTAGRAGFTSRYEDFYMVVETYTKKKPDNLLAKYLPRLKQLRDKGSDSTEGLEGIESAWKESAKDKTFRDIQDQISDQLYYTPAMKYASDLGVELAITKAFIYDTTLQHGDGKDADSVSSLIKRTNSAMGGKPKDGVDEIEWLNKFIEVRRADLKNPADESTQDAWSSSTYRCDIFQQILNDQNYNLDREISVKTRGFKAVIK